MVFTGRVQGVGFRYKMTYLANAYRVTGWVRNEYDGSVCAEVQGTPAELDKIVQSLGQERYIEIDGISRKKIPVRDDEREFRSC